MKTETTFNHETPPIANVLLPAGRCCLVCSNLSYIPSCLPDDIFDLNCDKGNFMGVANEADFKNLKTETTCEDFTPCR